MQIDTFPSRFEVHVRCLRTEPFCVGCCICLSWSSIVICPVVVLGNFLAAHGPFPRPLFHFADDHPLTCQLLSSTVQSLLRLAGCLGSCSGHSFWIGDATTAASWGLQVHLIRTLGRWFSGACWHCVHASAGSLGRVASLLVLQTGHLPKLRVSFT